MQNTCNYFFSTYLDHGWILVWLFRKFVLCCPVANVHYGKMSTEIQQRTRMVAFQRKHGSPAKQSVSLPRTTWHWLKNVWLPDRPYPNRKIRLIMDSTAHNVYSDILQLQQGYLRWVHQYFFAIMNITWDYILTCTTTFKLILNHKVCPKMHIFLHFKCLVNDIITLLLIIISHGLQWN